MENVTGATLVVVNSVCGCAAGLARPSAGQAKLFVLKKQPDHLVTVFAGQDKDANCKKCGNTSEKCSIFTHLWHC